MKQDNVRIIADELGITQSQVKAVIGLIDEGNTIPFIARYRKEMHGGLNDEVLRSLDERLTYLRNLEEKKNTVLSTIAEQGALTPELEKQIEECMTQVALDDLYRPYRPKRRTRAIIAREKGLEPLADELLAQEMTEPALTRAEAFVNEEKGVATAAEALAGARDIIAEMVSDNAAYRAAIRKVTMEHGRVTAAAKNEKAESVYEMYYHFEEAVAKIAGHRVLALNRGEAEKVLTVKVEIEPEPIIGFLTRRLDTKHNPNTAGPLAEAAADAYTRLIAPSIENDIRNTLTEKAEEGSLDVFGKNLNQLLMQPPIAGQVVLGWDPAFRTGCKLAVVDETGKVLDTVVIYPTAPQNKVAEGKRTVMQLIKKYGITLISVGNGTASRESEAIIAEMIRENHLTVRYVITNEAGASVYSASKLATEEFPQFDVGQRSAVSIARRVQDPLAELVKIDPKSIGVGQYQHDMNQKRLDEVLGGVVETCVNRVGVDVNTASAALLGYVSGISKAVAKNIVTYREENGSFTNRKQLLKVPKLGPKAYEQCAGFLRIRDGSEPLDGTAVHPESYEAARQVLSEAGYTPEEVAHGGARGIGKKIIDRDELANRLGVGRMTLDDIVNELEKPSRDPRLDAPAPILRSDVMDIKDLKEGMELKGTVRNIIDFGAFVDIGVHQDGLVHISQLSDRFIKHPLDAVKIGDVVTVRVLSVDPARKRIALTMKGIQQKKK